jgi:hypothetical protein
MKYIENLSEWKKKDLQRKEKKLNSQKYWKIFPNRDKDSVITDFYSVDSSTKDGDILILKFNEMDDRIMFFYSFDMNSKEIKPYYMLTSNCKYFIDKKNMVESEIRNATKEEIEEFEFYLTANKYNI